MTERRTDVTQALIAHLRGDPDAPGRLLPLVYRELRALAGGYMRKERRDHTLQPTALVHEAFIRLVDDRQVGWQGRSHFVAIAARQMRRILVDHARAHNAEKRGGGVDDVTLKDVANLTRDGVLDMLSLDEALQRLEREHPRRCRVVELRFFGGLSVEETAAELGVSAGTVKRDWRVAKARLARELSSRAPAP